MSDLDIIKMLEKHLSKRLELVDDIRWDTLGYKVEGDVVIGQGLYRCKLCFGC